MRFRNLFILGIGFVLLAFVYWPSNTPNSKMERQTFTQQPDSIPLTAEMKAVDKVKQLTLSTVLAEAIRRISNEESISAMFEH